MDSEDSSEPPDLTEWEKILEKHDVSWDTGSYDIEELDPPDWITDLDREICGLLGKGLILTPSILARNLDRPRSSVSRRLNTLEAGGIVEKVERGHYRLSDEGKARMTQKVDPEMIGMEEGPPGEWITYKILTPEEAEKFQANISE